MSGAHLRIAVAASLALTGGALLAAGAMGGGTEVPPGTTTTTTTVAGPEDTRGVPLKLFGRRLVLDRSGRVGIRARCPRSGEPWTCEGSISVLLGPDRVQLGRARVRITAGRTRTVRVASSTPGYRAARLGAAGQRAYVRAAVVDRAGSRARVERDYGLKPLAGLTVALNPGHNGANGLHAAEINALVPIGGGQVKACDTTGTATVDGFSEARFNFELAGLMRERLRRLGARVVMTRRDNSGVGPCIDERARIANRSGAMLALSIHADGGPAGGRGFHVIRPALIEGLTDDIYSSSRRLAHVLRAALDGGPVQRSSYVGSAGLDVRSDLGGLRLSDIPAVFVELANMRNPADAAIVESERGRRAIAGALTRGARAFLARR